MYKILNGAVKELISGARILIYFVGLTLYLFSVLLVWLAAFCFLNNKQ